MPETSAEHAVLLTNLNATTLKRSEALPCQNCGAEFPVHDAQISAICPFCDSALIRSQAHVHEHLPISQIIPFQINEATAFAYIQSFLGDATSVSRRRKAQILREIQLQPIYLSYYLFDADLHLKTRVHGTMSDYENPSREVELEGWVEGFLVPGCETQGIFASIPSVDGQAWHLRELQAYDPNGLAGTLATFPAVPLQEAASAASVHLDGIVSDRIHSAITETEVHRALRYQRKDEWVRALLVPVWLGQYSVGGHSYRVRVNGQTGETGIEIPAPRDTHFWQTIFYCVAIGFVAMFALLVAEDLGWVTRD